MDTLNLHANGIDMHLRRIGSGAPLVLLHGWPEWSRVWEPVMTRLAGRFDLVAPDFRGFGDSQKTSPGPAKDAGPEVLASDILALADVLGLGRFGLDDASGGPSRYYRAVYRE